jgi:SAM-dependent methyltransferase
MKYDYERDPQGIKFDSSEKNVNYIFLFKLISGSLLAKKKVKILEIGTGGGRNLQAIRQRFGSKVKLSGTDISKVAINYARSLKIGKFYLARSDVIPVAGRFDLILMIDVLEHLEGKSSIEKTLNNVLLHLKDDGDIYISVPIELNKFSLTWFFSKLPYFKNFTKAFYGHSLQFNIKSVLGLFDFNKFRLKEIFYSAHFLTQLQVLFFFFLPKILLRIFFGEKIANDLRDSSEIINKGKHSLLSFLKRIFVSSSYPLSYLAFRESSLRRNSSFAAGNMHLLITKRSVK